MKIQCIIELLFDLLASLLNAAIKQFVPDIPSILGCLFPIVKGKICAHKRRGAILEWLGRVLGRVLGNRANHVIQKILGLICDGTPEIETWMSENIDDVKSVFHTLGNEPVNGHITDSDVKKLVLAHDFLST